MGVSCSLDIRQHTGMFPVHWPGARMGIALQTSELLAFAEESPSAARPWLLWYGTVPASLSYPDLTLYEALAASAGRVPGAVAWDFMDTAQTYSGFLREIGACANGPAALGLRQGDRILIGMPASPQGIIAFYAANKLGAVPAMVHPLSAPPELEHYLNATGARIVLTLDAFYGRFAQTKPHVALERRVPTLYKALSRNPLLKKADLACLRAAYCGADKLPRAVKESFDGLVATRGGNVKLREGYGLTEAVSAIIAMPLDEYREGSTGVPFVVLKDRALATPAMEQELIEYCRSQLIKWSCPRNIEFRHELPKTRAGKIDYRALMDGEQAMKADGKPAEHGGSAIAATLEAHGVRLLFTLCGGHISPILAGAKARGIRVVDTRGEATAVFAAGAAGRLSGIPGVAAVTAGPGVTNAVTALQNAQMAGSPLVLLGGAAPTLLQGRGALQDIDQRPIAAPNVKFLKRIRRVRDLIPAVENAFAAARSGVQGPAFVECPVDLLYGEALVRQWYVDAAAKGTGIAGRLLRWYVERHLASMFGKITPARPPQAHKVAAPAVAKSSVSAAAKALSRASRPVAIVGSQTLAAGNDPARVAAAIGKLGLPVYLSGMARGLLGPAHPLQLRHKRREALKEAECVILAGVPCDFRLDYGNHVRRSATLIAANRSRKEARLNRAPDIGAIGDAGAFLEQLAGEAKGSGSGWRNWIASLHARDAAREAEIAGQAKTEGEFVNPIALLKAVDAAAADNAIFVADGGDFVGTAAYILRPRGPLGWLDPGPFGTLGVGGGFALGAALCRPGAEVWAIFGDGALGYSIAEFDTFVRHGIPIIAVVGNDAGWTQIAREQVKVLKDDVGTTLARSAYHEVAAGFGAEGILVTSNAEIPEALMRAKAAAKAGKPVLVNAWLDKTAFREGSLSM